MFRLSRGTPVLDWRMIKVLASCCMMSYFCLFASLGSDFCTSVKR